MIGSQCSVYTGRMSDISFFFFFKYRPMSTNKYNSNNPKHNSFIGEGKKNEGELCFIGEKKKKIKYVCRDTHIEERVPFK